MEVIEFDQQVSILQPFTSDVGGAREGDPPGDGQRVDLALQRHLHLAQGPEEGARRQRRPDPPRGDRGALRRRRHLEPGRLRRGARRRQALEHGHLRHRTEAEQRRQPRLQGGGVRAAPAVAGDRRTRVLSRHRRRAAEDLRADRPGTEQPVRARLHLEEPGAKRRVAAAVGAGRAAEHGGPYPPGLLRPGGTR